MRVRIILVAGPAALAIVASAFGCAETGSTTAAANPIADAAVDDDVAAIPWDDAGTPEDAGSHLGPVDASVTCTGKAAAPLDQTLSVTSKGGTRSAHVHVPASYDPKHG